ncbi:DUF6415 family natural product biosynthesis protein [Streptomyces echinoruber]|uniref:Uncharacterized protein n=1 Tax=Streptomyces echinoruber TaxID=68898 RepID=A0A918RPY7_9ACTN|nr:DUF6415 family natural product biosynthesis protein [Streptomyces echinoruber]GHA05695.1 hypothetical protein GCM10010389_51460 [Streptomyces echinoruber]
MTTVPREVDAAAIEQMIREAFDASRRLPSYPELVTLNEQLRAEINRLMPIVRDAAGRATPRSREWYAAMQAIEHAEYELRQPLGTGPLGGSMHVAELARRVVDLREAGGVQ